MPLETSPYQVLGTGIAQLLARGEDRSRIMQHLSKFTPDHVSLVGPRYIGKTVLLRALSDIVVTGQSSVVDCVYWDLRHNTPKSDEEFYQRFAQQLQPHMRKIDPALGTFLDESEGITFYNIKSLFEILSEDKKTVVIMFDGLDPVLRNTEIRKDLWDSLRGLADMSSFRMVTGTRQPLRELCMSPDSKTSDFFNIFAMNVRRLGPLTDRDSQEFLQPFIDRGISVSTASTQMLRKWCGGIPLLTAALCLDLWNTVDDGKPLTPQIIDSRAGDLCADETLQDYLYDFFWRDCSEQERSVLAEIVRQYRTDRPTTDPAVQTLMQKGFLANSQNGLTCPSKFMYVYASQQGESVTRLRSLFGSVQDFEENSQALLELRLSQFVKIDVTLRSHIEAIIGFLREPIEGAKLIRLFADRAYTIVLEHEVPSGELPQQWLDEWTREGLRDIPGKQLPSPSNRAARYFLVKNIADTRYSLQHRRITPDMQLLLAHLKLLGDFGHHLDSRVPTSSFMFSVCVTALELATQISDTYS
jgi:hypothetical protein